MSRIWRTRVCIARAHVDGIEDTVVVKVGRIGPEEHVPTAFHAVFLSVDVQVLVETCGHHPSPVGIEAQGRQALIARSGKASRPPCVLG